MANGTDYRINGRYMQTNFKRVCKAMGWAIVGNDVRCGSDVMGHTRIERAPYSKPLYRIVQIVTIDGGEKQLSRNYTCAELAAWFNGILVAHETLVHLHSNIAMAVDSLRGNERFIATAIRNSL